MKILYVASDRRAAEQAGLSLGSAAPGIRVAGAVSLGEALRWIDSNRDVSTVVVEVDSDIPSCELFVRQVRALVPVPVIVATVKDPAPTLGTLTSIADEIVAKTPSFFSDLPVIVAGVLNKARPASRPTRRALQFLYVGDAALARKWLARPGSIDVIEAVPGSRRTLDCLPADLSGAPLALDVVFIERGYPGVETQAILKDIAAREFHVPAVIVGDWDVKWAALSFKLGAIDYIVKSEASFQAVVFRLGRLLAHAAQLRARAGTDEAAATREQLARREAEYTENIAKAARERQALDEKLEGLDAALTREFEKRRTLEGKLAEARSSLENAEQMRLAEAAAAADKLAQQHAEFRTTIAQTARTRDALEQRINEALATIERTTSQHAQVESELAHQTAIVETLERQLAGAKVALQRAEADRSSEATAADARFTEQQTRYEARLSEAAANQGALQAQLVSVDAKMQRAEQQHASEIAAGAVRLAEQQQHAATRLAEAIEAADALEAKLSDAVAARECAEERASQFEGQLAVEAAERQELARHIDATEKEADVRAADAAAVIGTLERTLAETAAALQRLERQAADEQRAALDEAARRQVEFDTALAKQRADAQAARRQAEKQHASEMKDAVARLAAAEKEADARSVETAAVIRTLERTIADSAAALASVEQQAAAERQAAHDQATRRQAEFDAALTQEAARHEALATQLADAQSAHRQAEKQHATEMNDAVARLAAAEKEADARSADAAAVVSTLERTIAVSAAALTRVEQQAAVERQATNDQATRRQAEFDRALTQEAARREALAKQLADAQSAHRQAEQRHASEIAAAEERATVERQTAADEALKRQSEFEGQLAAEGAKRQELAIHLANAEAERREAEQQHASEMKDAVARLAASEEEADARSVETAAVIGTLERTIADSAAALTRLEQQAAEAQHAADEQARRRQAEFDAALTQEREAFAKQLAEAQSAHRQAEQQHRSDMEDAVARLAAAEEEAAARSVETAAVIGTLERTIADRAAALTRLEQQAAEAQHAADEQARRRQGEFDAALTEAATRHEALAKQLADQQEHAATRLAEAHAAADALAAKLNDAVAALERAEERASADRRIAADEALQRRAEFEGRLVAEVAKRADAETALQQAERQHASQMTEAVARLVATEKEADARSIEAAAAIKMLEHTLADTAATLRRTEQRAAEERQAAVEQHASEIEAAAARFAAYQKDTEAQLARVSTDAAEALRDAEQRAAADRAIAAAQAADRQAKVETTLGQEIAQRETVERELADVRASADQAERRFLDEAAAMRARARELEARVERGDKELIESENALARQRAEYKALQQTLDQTKATAEERLATLSTERAAERVTLEALVTERDGQLRDLAARHRASDDAAAKTLAGIEQRLRVAIDAASTDRQTIAQLRKEIDDIRAENRRHFDHTPVNMCRCAPDGTISAANHAFASFLGYGTPDELQKVDFAASVFESADELQWIVERCLASRSTESVETTWTRKDGSRIVVRVLAVATTPDSIDMTAEDITTLRVVEEKLRISQRMEAVARYASEVAVTCDNLLGHVEQEGLRWLARIDSDAARYHGELLLDEVTRAAKYVRQLAVYGNEEKKVPDLVDMNKVLRDLEPVLRRVAGSDIDLVLPKAAAPLNLDVEPERVERMLVNVAAYGRERMPLGGRLMFEVAPVVVDRKFVAKYPNVRPGAHVLLTVNEKRGAARADLSAVRNQATGASAVASGSQNPGVDLGALQALVSDCGGHLWMMVEPPGDMVLKIHLPRRVLDRPDRRPTAKASVRTRWINRPAGVRH